MKFKSIFLVLFITIYSNSNGQNFTAMPPGFNFQVRTLCYDSISNYLYAGGPFSALKDGTPMSSISRWNGLTWDSVGTGVNDGGQVYALTMYNGELIVGGSFGTIGGVYSPGLAKWNGSTWLPFANVNSSGYGCVYGLKVINNILFINGCFDDVNGSAVYGFIAYDGSSWITYPNLYQNSNYSTGATASFNNEIFVTGNFVNAPGIMDIARFDGNNWLSVGGGIQGGLSWFNCMKDYQSKLFCAGTMHLSAGDPGNGIAAWDGNSWDILNNGTGPNSASVFDMIIYKNELYVAGAMSEMGGIPVDNIAKWDGINWINIGGIFNNATGAFATNGTDLFIAGGFITVNGDSMFFITKYTNATGIEEMDNSCYSITPTISTGEFAIHSNCGGATEEIQVFNSMVQIVLRINKHNQPSTKIDLTNFPKGTYFASITNSEKKIIIKLITY